MQQPREFPQKLQEKFTKIFLQKYQLDKAISEKDFIVVVEKIAKGGYGTSFKEISEDIFKETAA